MSDQTKELLKSALKLPDTERTWLAEQILQSLPAEAEDAIDQAFLEELDRRAEEAEADPGSLVSWEDVKHLK